MTAEQCISGLRPTRKEEEEGRKKKEGKKGGKNQKKRKKKERKLNISTLFNPRPCFNY